MSFNLYFKSKLSALRIEPLEKGGFEENGRVAFPETHLFTFNWADFLMSTFVR